MFVHVAYSVNRVTYCERDPLEGLLNSAVRTVLVKITVSLDPGTHNGSGWHGDLV